MKKLFFVFLISFIALNGLNGCVDTSSYHDMTEIEDEWLVEQVKQGSLTKEEAKQIWAERQNLD